MAEAASDVEDARDFYELLEPGVGELFVDSILADMDNLKSFHGVHPMHFGFHRMLSDRFPFGIFYRDKGMETQVFAVLDLRRHPNWIRRELRKR
jgi:hypothetical protein